MVPWSLKMLLKRTFPADSTYHLDCLLKHASSYSNVLMLPIYLVCIYVRFYVLIFSISPFKLSPLCILHYYSQILPEGNKTTRSDQILLNGAQVSLFVPEYNSKA